MKTFPGFQHSFWRHSPWTISGFWVGFCLWLCLGIATPALGESSSTRKKVIDFEGDLVEGMNKRPLDSLSEVSEVEKRRKKMHLYRKRKGFKTEIQEQLRQMRYVAK